MDRIPEAPVGDTDKLKVTVQGHLYSIYMHM